MLESTRRALLNRYGSLRSGDCLIKARATLRFLSASYLVNAVCWYSMAFLKSPHSA